MCMHPVLTTSSLYVSSPFVFPLVHPGIREDGTFQIVGVLPEDYAAATTDDYEDDVYECMYHLGFFGR